MHETAVNMHETAEVEILCYEMQIASAVIYHFKLHFKYSILWLHVRNIESLTVWELFKLRTLTTDIHFRSL